MYKASYIYGSILCIAPPILHKMVPIYIVSYVLFHLMYTDYCRVLLLCIRWSYSLIPTIMVHLMYTDYCEVLLLYIRWSLDTYSVIRTIMGPSYVQQLLWGLTPVHKHVNASYVGRNIVTQILPCHSGVP